MHCLAGKTFLVNTENPCSDWLDLYIPAEDQPDVRAAVQRAIDTKTPFELEHRVIQADGQLGWTFSRAVPLLDGNGEITEWLGAASNITLRRQAETQLREFNALLEAQMAERTEALQENKDLLQSVLDTSLISMVVLKAVRDENGNMTDFYTRLVNKQLERETGRTDLVGKLYAEQFPGLRPTGVFDLMRRVMDTGNPEGMEYHYAHEGLDKWYSSLFVKLDDGLVATHLDITERKQAEAELNKQYELLRQAEDVARMGSWEYDIASGAFHWSEGMYRLFGLPLNSPISVHTYLAFAVDEDRPVAERIVRRLHDTHRPFEETLRIQVEDQLVTLKIKAVVLHDSQQRPVRILGVDVDISELKRLEQEKLDIKLGQQKQLLIAILDAQEEERRRVAESLHNGVGQILYATKLHLERVGRLLPTDTPAGQALQTTDSLLSEAIEETRRVSHELMPVSLNDFGIAAALHDLCRKYQGSALRLDCRVAVFRQRLESHLELALYRISQELITNIVRHSEASEASIVLKKQGNHLLLRVIDNGRGFAYDPERTRGLGLRATTDRVKLLGGTFSVSRTERGLGTVVTVRIPAD